MKNTNNIRVLIPFIICKFVENWWLVGSSNNAPPPQKKNKTIQNPTDNLIKAQTSHKERMTSWKSFSIAPYISQ